MTLPASFHALHRWQREGEAGERWLAELPEMIADCCDRWGLVVDGDPAHGSNGLAVPVRRDGEPLVLKVSPPGPEVEDQARALATWDGRGMVLLVQSDPAAGFLLLERLDASRTLSTLPLGRAVPIVGQVLRALAVPATETFRTTWDEAQDYRTSLTGRWDEAGRPFPRRLLDAALGLAEETAGGRPPATDHSPLVMVDRDLHYDDVLSGTREPWLAVDPHALSGEPAFQVAQLLWTRFDDMAGSGTLGWCFDALVDAAGLEEDRARSWLVLRCVDYWLWGLDTGLTEDPVRCRAILESLGQV